MREKKSWKVFPFEYCDVEYMQAWLRIGPERVCI